MNIQLRAWHVFVTGRPEQAGLPAGTPANQRNWKLYAYWLLRGAPDLTKEAVK